MKASRIVADTKINQVAAAELAINGEIERRQVSNTFVELKVNANRPVCFVAPWPSAYSLPVPVLQPIDLLGHRADVAEGPNGLHPTAH